MTPQEAEQILKEAFFEHFKNTNERARNYRYVNMLASVEHDAYILAIQTAYNKGKWINKTL